MNGIWTERTLTSNGASTRPTAARSRTRASSRRRPTTCGSRASFDGTNVITEYSYDGETLAEIAPPVPADQYGPNGVTKIGLFVKHDSGAAAEV